MERNFETKLLLKNKIDISRITTLVRTSMKRLPNALSRQNKGKGESESESNKDRQTGT